jgi:hypothetical protein
MTARLAALRDVATSHRSSELAQGRTVASAEPVDITGGLIVLMLFVALGAALGLAGWLAPF